MDAAQEPTKTKLTRDGGLEFNQIATLKSLCIQTTDDQCYYPFFLDGMKAHEGYDRRILSLLKELRGQMLEGGDGLGEEGISSKVIAYGHGYGCIRTIITVANGNDAALEKFCKHGDELEKREEKLDRLIQEAWLRIEKGRREG